MPAQHDCPAGSETPSWGRKMGGRRTFGLKRARSTKPKHGNAGEKRGSREEAGGKRGEGGARASGKPGWGRRGGGGSGPEIGGWRRTGPGGPGEHPAPLPASASPPEQWAQPQNPRGIPLWAQTGSLPRPPGLTWLQPRRRLTWARPGPRLPWPRPGRGSRAGPAPAPPRALPPPDLSDPGSFRARAALLRMGKVTVPAPGRGS